MVRAISVLISVRALSVFPVVMLVADALALAAIVFSPVPIIQVMGGTDPQATLVSDTALSVLSLGGISFPVWVILTGVAGASWDPAWSVPESQPSRRIGRALSFACACVAAWAIAAVIVR